MIDIDALEKAIEDFEQYTAFMNAEGGKLIIDAARLVLAAVPTHHAVAAAVNGMLLEDPLPMEMFDPDEREELARAALTAAGIHIVVGTAKDLANALTARPNTGPVARMPTRKEIAETIAKRDGSPYGNYENYLGDADRILALLGGTA